MFKVILHIFEQPDDRQMLRTDAFALATFDTIRSLASFAGEDVLVGEIDRPALLFQILAHIFVI